MTGEISRRIARFYNSISIPALWRTVRERDGWLLLREKTIVDLEKTILEREKTIVELEKTIVEREQTVVEREQTVHELEVKLQDMIDRGQFVADAKR
jgi:uncharacterized coiled-coil protein SlyX